MIKDGKSPPNLRAMWLLNHGTAQKFEVAMLKQIGIKEIFLPKHYPAEPGFRSASIDRSEDINLSIPKEALQLLNNTNWYTAVNKNAWSIANQYFHVLFFILYDEEAFKSIVKNFKGTIILRGYGLLKESTNYSSLLPLVTKNIGLQMLQQLGNRFWFAHAYEHQGSIEKGVLRDRALYLPLGMSNITIATNWTGTDKKILFICPDIQLHSYYGSIYQEFITHFKALPYAIGGSQTLAIDAPHILGYLSDEAHARNMREMRVMFYHSTEPNHIHYHPFEAVRAGMPLIFMAGGLLDTLGGKNLPGRCKTFSEARRKIKRILNDDWKFIEKIRQSQTLLLNPMDPSHCLQAWQAGFKSISNQLIKKLNNSLYSPKKKTRIAIIIPIQYRGGSLRGARLLAQAIQIGSQQAGEEIEIIFGYLNAPSSDEKSDLGHSSARIKYRIFHWNLITQEQATRAMIYAGKEQVLTSDYYLVPEDGMKQFTDCDLWIIISDRLSSPLLPIRPYILMVYDYLQRYQPLLSAEDNQQFISVAQTAECILVTTEFTKKDAIQFTGLSEKHVHKLPMLAPVFPYNKLNLDCNHTPYFLWTTNLAVHKNHLKALKALQIYYEKYQGKFLCKISGVETKNLFNNTTIPHLQALHVLYKNSVILKQKIEILGELSDISYQETLAKAQFLWHAATIDNGTFSAIEAAHFRVPSLSSDYPAMREIDEQFHLNLSWMNTNDPEGTAARLKEMELNVEERRLHLPSQALLATQSVEQLANQYWAVLREYI